MNLEEIREALTGALELRSPRFDPDARPAAKIAALEDYMLLSAHVNGGLVAARHWLRTLIDTLAEEWEKLQGWEVAAPNKPRARLTAPDIHRAKIQVAPSKWEAGREAKRLMASIDDQIARLEREERVCSRAYTMISGK